MDSWHKEAFLESYAVAIVLQKAECGEDNTALRELVDEKMNIRWMWNDADDAFEHGMDILKSGLSEDKVAVIEEEEEEGVAYENGSVWSEWSDWAYDIGMKFGYWNKEVL